MSTGILIPWLAFDPMKGCPKCPGSVRLSGVWYCPYCGSKQR